jgi:pyrimidine deaminase RibD-like protein
MVLPYDDTYFMKKALQEAEAAFDKGEVPIGAIIVIKDRIIARAHNLTEQLNDVTAHAEMQAITAAANFIGGKYLQKVRCTGVRYQKSYMPPKIQIEVVGLWGQSYTQKQKLKEVSWKMRRLKY